MQIKGNAAAKSTSAVVLCILVCVSIYTHILSTLPSLTFQQTQNFKMYKPWTPKGRFSQNQSCNTFAKLLLVKVPKDGAIALHCLRKRDLQDIGTQPLDNLVVNKNMLPTCESSSHTGWCFRNPGKIHHLLPVIYETLWKIGIFSKWTCAGFLPSTHVFGTTRRRNWSS